jgi:hypothetical protein
VRRFAEGNTFGLWCALSFKRRSLLACRMCAQVVGDPLTDEDKKFLQVRRHTACRLATPPMPRMLRVVDGPAS